MNIRSTVLAAAVCVVVLPGLAERASACSCRYDSVQSVIESTPIVFEGEILDVRMTGVGNEQVTTVRVLRLIKGDVSGDVEIATHTFSASCGYDFRGRSTRLTFGAYRGADGGLTTNLCTMFMLNPR